MTYPLPTNETVANITGMFSLFEYVQVVSSGWFFLMILLGIFIVVFISLKNYSSSRAFASAAFLNMILSIMLRTIGFISNKWMYLSIVIVAFAIVWLHIEGSSSQ